MAMDDPVTNDDLVSMGFENEIITRWNGPNETGFYLLPGWEPVPRIDYNQPPVLYASIGSQQWTIRAREDLVKFINKAIPTFCEKIT